MRIIITGGAGFIGSHVVEDLQAHQHDLMVIDNFSRGIHAHIPAGVAYASGDISSHEMAEQVAAFKPDAMVHLAAQMDVTTSMKTPLVDAQTNILGTLNMLHAAKNAGAKTFVSASSGGAIYGDPTVLPAREGQTPVAPLSPYGASKYCSEVYLDLYQRSFGMRCVSLRLSNVFGPRQSDGGEAGVVAIFSKRMLQNQAPTIFGDGLQTRDFVYVGDVARAVRKAVEGDASGAFNIATQEQTSLLDLVGHLKNITHFTGDTKFSPGLPGEVRQSSLNYDHAIEDLSWRPITSLFDGLRNTVDEQKRAFARETATI